MWAKRAAPALVVAAIALVSAGPTALTAARMIDDQYVLANARSSDYRRFLFAYSNECPGVDCTTSWWSAPRYRRRFVRVAPSLLLKATVALAGDDPRALHLPGLALHALNGVLVYLLLGLLGLGRRDATLAAALFAAHPAGAEMAGAVSFACVPVAAAFTLGSLCLWRRYRLGGRSRDAALCLASTLLAMTSYEAAVALPVVLVASDRLLHRERWPRGRPPRFAYAQVALLAPYFALRALVHTEDIARPFGVLLAQGVRLGVAESVGYLLKVFALLSWRTMSPYWLHEALGEVAATVVAALALAAIVYSARGRPLAWVGLAIFAGFLGPPVAVRALVGVFNNPTMRQIYLPLVGAAVFVGALGLASRRRGALAGWAAVAFLCTCSWRFCAMSLEVNVSPLSEPVKRALAGVDPTLPVAWIGQPPRYHVNLDWPGRAQIALVPPPLGEGELALCRGDSPRVLIARAESGFSGGRYPQRNAPRGPLPSVDYLEAIWTRAELFARGTEQLPFARVDLVGRVDPGRNPPIALRYTLDRDVDAIAFLRYRSGSVIRVLPGECPAQ